MSIVAIVSGVHSAGKEIAKQVASRLNYDFVGEDLLEEAAQTYGTSVEKLARSMGNHTFLNSVTHEREKSTTYIKAQLARHLTKDNLVYHGPATHLIPSNISHALKVGTVAEPGFRVKRAVDQTGIGPETAAQQIEKADADSAHWVKQLFTRGPSDRLLYDIMIPIPATSPGDAVDMICENVAKEALIPNDQSVQAALDFLLAMRVNLALLKSGYYYCDVLADEDKVTVLINKKPPISGSFPRAIQMLHFELIEKKIREICLGFEEVNEVETLRGSGRTRLSPTLLVDEHGLEFSSRLETCDISSTRH